ncbi:LPS export ABC transporter permease LptF [Abyssibacter sp.]|jgi:lipopolysaccharide export system permease protein|uniref:LPS export ABC transporter permease LptF n=1 Tax=Abyssibacter sp. TaxID=2320200 RepID=UPI0025C3D666|nr:LPS export ABC transporter permease LptF [Abyssibacter sp.]MCK5858714.1 LPS export ABC transporter permease LptF [Abyssibacter sp.]
MRPLILDRYLFREAGLTWVAVTLVLLAIMLSTRFARFLGLAASGELPETLLLQVVALSSVQYLVILIPVSLLLAVMLSLGRLYRDSEMAAIAACGVSLGTLYRPFIRLGIALAAITAILSFALSPWAGRTADYLIKRAQQQIAFSAFEPGQFRTIPGVPAVFYVERRDAAEGTMEQIFVRSFGEARAGVLVAQSGRESIEADTGDRTLALKNGYRYEGQPGQAAFRVLSFVDNGFRFPAPSFVYEVGKRKIAATTDLLASGQPEDIAELQWRASSPITVLLLALLAVPLSHTSPRQGRYAKLILGIGAYIVYVNVLGVAQAWVGKGLIPAWLGMWWVHMLVALAVVWLYLFRDGRLRLLGRSSS